MNGASQVKLNSSNEDGHRPHPPSPSPVGEGAVLKCKFKLHIYHFSHKKI